MRTFKLDPNGFKEIRKKTIIRTVPLMLLAVIAGLFISSVNQNNDIAMVDTLPIMIPIIMFLIGFGLYKMLKRHQDMWNTFELTIAEEAITRTQKNIPTVTINKRDIKEIVEAPGGYILLLTQQRTNFISIPSSVIERDQLLEALADYGQITKQQGNKNYLIAIIASLAAIVLFVLFFVSHNSIIVVPAGIVLIIGLLWSFLETQRSKLIDNKTKRNSYAIFIVLFAIIGKILMELKIF